MSVNRTIQAIAGATLSIVGLIGLTAISPTPAVAEEHPGAPDAEATYEHMHEMEDMLAHCNQTRSDMMSDGQMSDMMGDGEMSGMMGNGGMSDMMGRNR